MPRKNTKLFMNQPKMQDKGDSDSNRGTPEVTSRPRALRGRRGGLKNMLEMPIDILIKICIRLEPRDLQHLARTTKSFRSFLMSHASAWIWRTSRETVHGLPELPPHLNEAMYANLLFSPHCHSCIKGNVKNIVWHMDARYCKSCLMSLTVSRAELSWQLRQESGLSWETLKGPSNIVQFAERNLLNFKVIGMSSMRYSISEMQCFARAVKAAQDDDQFSTLIKEWEARCREKLNISDWDLKKTVDRRIALSDIKRRRLTAIKSRLRDAGWGEDLDYLIDEEGAEALSDLSCVCQPNDLTERGWTSIRPSLFELMQSVRERRIYNARKVLLRMRFRLFYVWIREHTECDKAGCSILPVDYAVMPEIRAILDDLDDVNVTAKSFSPLLEILPDLTRRWYERIEAVLKDTLKKSLNITDCDEPLSLAVACFDGNTKGTYGRYPKVLSSDELRPKYCGSDVFLNAIRRDPKTGMERSSLDMDRLQTLKPALDIVKLIEVFGGNPLTTTYDEITKSAIMVRCTSSICRDAFLKPMSWHRAIGHLRVYSLLGFSLEAVETNNKEADNHTQTIINPSH
ncbi:hypothetical protein OBBRIDRAFT_824516 [Obba rivulosa]|uniref:F-box domain-containing protein n=1 Tax=Obba rivulosa TaxID=1052685 RepID=A0A8E2DP30_9APHY|nr:hypothetical protein OBBRIDRAFT_824516 [Obba rivulosa]